MTILGKLKAPEIKSRALKLLEVRLPPDPIRLALIDPLSLLALTDPFSLLALTDPLSLLLRTLVCGIALRTCRRSSVAASSSALPLREVSGGWGRVRSGLVAAV